MVVLGLVWFLSKKIIKSIFLYRKIKTELKPVQTSWFRFGQVFLDKNRFKLVWLGFSGFGSVFTRFGYVFFPVWLGFFRFGLIFSVSGRFFQNFNRFNRFFSRFSLSSYFFFRFSRFNRFFSFFARPQPKLILTLKPHKNHLKVILKLKN